MVQLTKLYYKCEVRISGISDLTSNVRCQMRNKNSDYKVVQDVVSSRLQENPDTFLFNQRSGDLINKLHVHEYSDQKNGYKCHLFCFIVRKKETFCQAFECDLFRQELKMLCTAMIHQSYGD